MLTEDEWNQFFALLERVVNMSLATYKRKAEIYQLVDKPVKRDNWLKRLCKWYLSR